MCGSCKFGCYVTTASSFQAEFISNVVQANLNSKLAEFTDKAKNFTLDGGMIYDFKDEDDYKAAKKDLTHLRKAMAQNWEDAVLPPPSILSFVIQH